MRSWRRGMNRGREKARSGACGTFSCSSSDATEVEVEARGEEGGEARLAAET